jgi:hypothetical protein
VLEAKSSPGAAGRVKSMKTFSDIIGNRTRDLPDFSAVLQLTGQPRYTHNSSLQRTFRDNGLAVIELSLPAVHFLAFRRSVSRVSAMETWLVNIALTTRPTLPFLLFTGTMAVVNGTWSCEV